MASEAKAEAEAETKSSPSKGEPSKSGVAESALHLSAGKRDLMVGDVNSAVDKLAEAAQMFGEEFGEGANECAEVYFWYGKALLECARLESGVIAGLPEDEEDDDGSTEESEEDEGEASNKPEEEEKPESQNEEKPKAEEEGNESESKGEKSQEPQEEEEKDGQESIGSNEAGPSAAKEEKDVSAIAQEDEDDPSNLQLAWEILELAKNCFQRHSDSLQALDPKRLELESRLSETFQVLGELSIENENYTQAVQDLTSCLRRRQELLPEDSRCIAETHYQLGVALGFNMEFDKAVESLQEAIDVMNNRISLLKEGKDSNAEKNKKDAFYTFEKEIEEIEGIIPEIKEKIQDTRDMQEETMKKVQNAKEAMFGISSSEIEVSGSDGGGSGNSSSTNNTNGNGSSTDHKATSDISHMIKKRKKEESNGVNGGENGAEAKKAKTDAE